MGKELFGTDGIRGVAGEYPLDRATVYAFGVALGQDVRAHGGEEVLIGADTRESGEWISGIAAGGLESCGVRVRYAGVITTPGVAYLTRTGAFAAGVMISASHNPYRDNGLKVFGHSGFKLPDTEEHEIEQEIFRLREKGLTPAAAPLTADGTLAGRYLDYLASTCAVRFDGLRLVADCGNGASYRLAPELFARLGAEVRALCTEPDGRNINLNCGALHIGPLQRAVVEARADLGVAFDGDADRAIFVSASGAEVNGDGVLLASARALKADGRLAGDTVVSTVMANLGLEKALDREGRRSPAGRPSTRPRTPGCPRPGPRERLVTPRPPVHRVARMLQQVWAGGVLQSVSHASILGPAAARPAPGGAAAGPAAVPAAAHGGRAGPCCEWEP